VTPVLRTSHFASQLAGARTGLGLALAAHQFAGETLVEVAHAKGLDGAWEELPEGTLWLVGHKALRHVPRIAAVWDFVVETMRGA
jgi:DNA-binding transcriptional LysR family regulator